ncbi:hypothetical protein MMC25_001558 [Agyrium rufum]|nr:hypothetical protein [Agyrium rufum]
MQVVLKSAKKDDSNLAREIHHHRQFLHPHIARLYEVIVTENLVWLVLEYCPGDELYNYLLNHGSLPVEKVQRIFTQLVGAVTYVHELSCVHRDLKLENILLDKHENVKLCDFGFTREYEGKSNYLQTFCGTVCYSAPEMLKGEKYAGEKVDVWSLGIILFALLTGELPFDEDDELATKHKILTTEPKYPDSLPEDAKALLKKLLSRRPLHRPSLSDILMDPFLAEHAPAQQAILKLTQPAPFSTRLEKETLERMRSAGIDIDQVIEHVLSQRCDSLAGWWALLIEKEERKEMRRERKRKDREQEVKSLRRISAASSRFDRVAPALIAVDEGGVVTSAAGSPLNSEGPRTRGRRERRSFPNPQITIPELPRLPEGAAIESPASSNPPPPIEKDSIRSASSSRHRPPQPPPKPRDRRRSRGSTLQLVSTNPELLPAPINKRRSRRHQLAIFTQLISIKEWFLDQSKRGKSPASKSDRPISGVAPSDKSSAHEIARKSPLRSADPGSKGARVSQQPQDQQHLPNSHIPSNYTTTTNARGSSARTPPPRLSSNHRHRMSISPAPLTPISYRRANAGLRGRKSTSSSVSSIRSIHHIHSHSKASSTSSTSNSIPSGLPPAGGHRATPSRSPHPSVKVLPNTPTTSVFPAGIRLVRNAAQQLPPINDPHQPRPYSHISGMANEFPSTSTSRTGRTGIGPPKSRFASIPASPPLVSGPTTSATPTATSSFNESASFNTSSSAGTGLVFAKRKRTPFRGPRLDLHATGSTSGGNSGGSSGHNTGGGGGGGRERDHSLGRSQSQVRAQGEDPIAEEDEEEEVEEVEAFSPLGPGVEETVWEAVDDEPKGELGPGHGSEAEGGGIKTEKFGEGLSKEDGRVGGDGHTLKNGVVGANGHGHGHVNGNGEIGDGGRGSVGWTDWTG